MTGKHTLNAAIPDMFLLAWTLFIGGYADASYMITAYKLRMFDSLDIF
jgi:hypothetical protein